MMKINKKELYFLVLFSVALVFAFIYIKDILAFIGYLIKIFILIKNKNLI